MPYIPEELYQAAWNSPRDVGELTYHLTRAVLNYLRRDEFPSSFADYAEAIAALEATKLELYRRAIAPHEDKKAAQNGDVYA